MCCWLESWLDRMFPHSGKVFGQDPNGAISMFAGVSTNILIPSSNDNHVPDQIRPSLEVMDRNNGTIGELRNLFLGERCFWTWRIIDSGWCSHLRECSHSRVGNMGERAIKS